MQLTPPPFSELLRVLLHALVLGELHQLSGGSAHVDGGGPGRGQVVQGLPDETHGVVAAGARPQLHGQAEAAHDGDGGGSPHLPGRARGRVSVAGGGSLLFLVPTSFSRHSRALLISLHHRDAGAGS